MVISVITAVAAVITYFAIDTDPAVIGAALTFAAALAATVYSSLANHIGHFSSGVTAKITARRTMTTATTKTATTTVTMTMTTNTIRVSTIF